MNLVVEMLFGNIVDFQADVLVNVIAVDTNQLISAGVVSQAFLTAGGQQLQRDFEQQTQPREFGKDVAVTRACGDLKAKFIYHAAAGHYEDENSAKHLYDTIFKCLTMAIKAEQVSIAFPTVGCGKLGFPVTIVADCFTRALKDTGSTTLKVSILTLDDKIYKTFSAIFQHVSCDNVASPERKLPTCTEVVTKVEKVVEDPATRQRTPETLRVSETATQQEASAARTSRETASTTGIYPNNDSTVQPLQPSDNNRSSYKPPEPSKEAASAVTTAAAVVVENIGADATFALPAQQPPRLMPASQSSLPTTVTTTTSPAQVALKEHVLKILTFNDETVAKLLQKFEDLGVDTPSDILMLTEADVQDCLKTIHFRKLIAATKGTATGFKSTEPETTIKDSYHCSNPLTGSASHVDVVRPVPLTPKPVVHTDVVIRHPVRAAGSRQSLEPSTYYSSYAAAPKRASSMIAERAAKFDPSFAGQAASAVHDSNSSREDSTSSSSIGRPSSVLLTAPRGFTPRKDSTVRPVIQSPHQELLPVSDDVVLVPAAAAAAAADDAKPDIGDSQTSG